MQFTDITKPLNWDEIELLALLRNNYRRLGDFPTADRLRDILFKGGVSRIWDLEDDKSIIFYDKVLIFQFPHLPIYDDNPGDKKH